MLFTPTTRRQTPGDPGRGGSPHRIQPSCALLVFALRARWSAVFRKDAGEWQFVQTHASIAIPNDQIGWSYEG